MGTASDPAATVHPGAVRAIFDHLLLSLTPDGQPGPPALMFSHYRFRWSDDGVVGELAFVEVERTGRTERLILTDTPALAANQAGRLSPRSWPASDVVRPAAVATFAPGRLGGPTVNSAVTSDHLAIDVEWMDLAAPIFASGPAPRLPSEDIVSVLIEARTGRATVDGRAVPGSVFVNDAWIAWLGRPLNSAVVALGEVLLTRP
jgi:hypothetical protein